MSTYKSPAIHKNRPLKFSYNKALIPTVVENFIFLNLLFKGVSFAASKHGYLTQFRGAPVTLTGYTIIV